MTSPSLPPQAYLDALHRASVPAAFAPEISPRQREERISGTRRSLQETRGQLQAILKPQKKRGRGSLEVAQSKELAPYALLATLADELLAAINDLDEATQKGRILPSGFDFGRVIFGDAQTGEWHLGEAEDAARFQEMRQTHQRLQTLAEERGPLAAEMRALKAQMQQRKRDSEAMMKRYRQRAKPAYMRTRLMILLLIALVLGIGGAIIALLLEQPLGFAGVGLGIACLLLMLIVWRGHKRGQERLRQSIQHERQEMAELQKEARKLRERYYPLERRLDELRSAYRELRASFEWKA